MATDISEAPLHSPVNSYLSIYLSCLSSSSAAAAPRVDNITKCHRQRRFSEEIQYRLAGRQADSVVHPLLGLSPDQTDIRKLLFFHRNDSETFHSGPFVIGFIINRPVNTQLRTNGMARTTHRRDIINYNGNITSSADEPQQSCPQQTHTMDRRSQRSNVIFILLLSQECCNLFGLFPSVLLPTLNGR